MSLLKVFPLVKRENPERNPAWGAFTGLYVLVTRRESTWQQIVFIKMPYPWGKQSAALKLITRLKSWGKHDFLDPIADAITSKMSDDIVLHEIKFKFVRNYSQNYSEIIPFWISCLRSRSDQLCKSWGKPLKSIVKPLQPKPLSLHLLPSLSFLLSRNSSAPCWNGGFRGLFVCFGGLVLFCLKRLVL